MLVLPIMLWLGYKEIKSHLEQPQAVFTGWVNAAREVAAEFASQYPDLPVWISGGTQKTTPNRYLPKLGLTAVA